MKKKFMYIQDPISFVTHFWGAVFSAAFMILFILVSILHKNSLAVTISLLIFGCSLIALYSASAYYHTLSNTCKKKKWFRKLDHSMIYCLIAGTYTPIAYMFLPRNESMRFLLILWVIALVGIGLKVCWMNAPRILYTTLYLLMGWAVVFKWQAFSQMPIVCLGLIAFGGLLYTAGAIMYMLKRPNISSQWGFHELFHVCILGGSLFHILAVLFYVA